MKWFGISVLSPVMIRVLSSLTWRESLVEAGLPFGVLQLANWAQVLNGITTGGGGSPSHFGGLRG